MGLWRHSRHERATLFYMTPPQTLKAAQLVQRDASLEPVDVSLLRRIAGAKKKKQRTLPSPAKRPTCCKACRRRVTDVTTI